MQIQASEKTDQILPALGKVQMHIPVIEAVQKADIPTRNGGRMQYAYANLTDVWRQVKPVLQDHGLVLSHPTRVEGDQCYLQTILWHTDSCQWIGSEIPLDVKEKDSRPVGARISFMRRYCSLALLAIPTSDDDEARHFAELQRAERRTEAKERGEALKTPRAPRGMGAGLPASAPPSEPPRREEPPRRGESTPPAASQQGPPPAAEPTPQEEEKVVGAPTVEQLVQMIVAQKKRTGGHPKWVIVGIAGPVGCEHDKAVSKRNLTTLVNDHPQAAIDLGRQLVDAASRAGGTA